MSRLLDKLEKNKEGKDTHLEMQDSINMPALMQKIHDILSREQWESKSNITDENAYGIIQACNFNNYIEETLGKEFRITVLDKLIVDKLRFVLSINGTGTGEILKGLNSLQPVISSYMPPTIVERLAYGNMGKVKKE